MAPVGPSTHLHAIEELLRLIVPIGVIIRPVLALEVLGTETWEAAGTGERVGKGIGGEHYREGIKGEQTGGAGSGERVD